MKSQKKNPKKTSKVERNIKLDDIKFKKCSFFVPKKRIIKK